MMPFWRLGIVQLAAQLVAGSPAGAAPPLADDARQPPAGQGVVQASATPILLSLLKQLRLESERSSLQEQSVAGWCRGAKELQAGLLETLERQRGEVSRDARQLGLEAKRLESEERLANLTGREKQQQLLDAKAIADFASGEFASEQRQAATTIDATRRAALLARSRGAAQRPERAAPGEESFEERLGSAEGGPGAGEQRQRGLLQSLGELQGGMELEQGAAGREQGAMLAKFGAFADHLGSSIMETQSQTAAFGIEAAQRKREQERLDGRLSDLSALLDAVRAGEAAAAGLCDGEGARKREVAASTSAESKMVATLLKRLHAADALGEGSPEASGDVGAADADAQAPPPEDAAVPPPSLLQAASAHRKGRLHRAGAAARGGARAAQPAEEEEQGSEELEQLLDPRGGAAGQGGAMRDIEEFVKLDADAAEEEGAEDDASASALQDIKQFVASSAAAESSAAGAGERRAMRRREREQERSLERQQAAERRSYCTSILQEGRKDLVALSRSLERANAKLNINKATVLEYEQASEYVLRQQKLVENQLERLAALAKGARRWVADSRPLLRGHAEQLMALATDLGSEERGAAQAVRDLAQRVEGHQGALQQYADELRRSQRSAEAADRSMLQRLAEDAEASRRRLTRLQAEGQVLASLVRAKAGARTMSMRYQDTASALCSREGA